MRNVFRKVSELLGLKQNAPAASAPDIAARSNTANPPEAIAGSKPARGRGTRRGITPPAKPKRSGPSRARKK